MFGQTRLKRRPLRGARRLFRKDRRGTAALEFAILAPVLTAFFFGGVSTYQAVLASRSVTFTANTLADLISRQTVILEDEREDVYRAAEVLLSESGDVDELIVSIASISNPGDDEDDDPVLDWSYSSNPSKKLKNKDLEDLDMPALNDNDSVVLARVSVKYVPSYAVGEMLEMTLEETSFRRPRFVPRVTDEPDADD